MTDCRPAVFDTTRPHSAQVWNYYPVEDVTGFSGGLELTEPGIVSWSYWGNGPEPGGPSRPLESCGIGREP